MNDDHPHPILKNILALCIGIGISLSMLAGFVVLFCKSGIILNQHYNANLFLYKEDKTLGYIFNPNQSVTRRGDSGEFTVSINNIGFRDAPYDPAYTKTMTYRIMALGDSFTFGGKVDKPYPSFIESQLSNKIQQSLHVFNFGTPGYGTLNDYGILQMYGPQIRPNLVLVAFFLGNDFHDNLIPLNNIKVIDGYLVYNFISWADKQCVLSDDELNSYVAVAKAKKLSPYSLAQLIRVDKFGNHMTFTERTVRQLGINFPAVRTLIDTIKTKLSVSSILSFGIVSSAYYRVTAEEEQVAREYLTKIKDKCQELKAELILVIIPEYIGNYDNGERRTILKNLCREAGITHIIDLFPIFKDAMARYYLESDAHFSPAGHEATAEIIASYILDHHLLDPEGNGPGTSQR